MRILNLLDFYLKYYIFGPHTALNALKRYPKYSIIPILKKFGAVVGDKCDIESGITFHNCTDFTNLNIGNNCHIGKDCFFDLRDKITIEENVVISMKNTLITHIDMTKSDLTKLYKPSSKSIYIENNSYLGANCTILMGVNIGSYSFIAANSLVKTNITNNCLYGGVPAKFIKKIDLKNG